MKNESLLGPWVRRFLLEHLVTERNLSLNTRASYRDTLMLLLPFASKQDGGAIDRMTVEDLTPAVVRKFLDYLERDRQCSDVTRNQRLATIHQRARRASKKAAWSDHGVEAPPLSRAIPERPALVPPSAQPSRRGIDD
jgi:site-specific recombinase XerD